MSNWRDSVRELSRWYRGIPKVERGDADTRLKRLLSQPIADGTETAELRAAIQADMRNYAANDVYQFMYATPEIITAKDPYGAQIPFSCDDGQYFVVSRSMVERILRETKVDTISWVAEKRDCDDIAKYLSALMAVQFRLNSFGVVRSYDGGHAFSFALVHGESGLGVMWIEPQTDEILTRQLGAGMYKLGPGYATFRI